jgi:hypothetical protein
MTTTSLLSEKFSSTTEQRYEPITGKLTYVVHSTLTLIKAEVQTSTKTFTYVLPVECKEIVSNLFVSKKE